MQQAGPHLTFVLIHTWGHTQLEAMAVNSTILHTQGVFQLQLLTEAFNPNTATCLLMLSGRMPRHDSNKRC